MQKTRTGGLDISPVILQPTITNTPRSFSNPSFYVRQPHSTSIDTTGSRLPIDTSGTTESCVILGPSWRGATEFQWLNATDVTLRVKWPNQSQCRRLEALGREYTGPVRIYCADPYNSARTPSRGGWFDVPVNSGLSGVPDLESNSIIWTAMTAEASREALSAAQRTDGVSAGLDSNLPGRTRIET